jgi:hypothetical protein
MLEEEEQFVIVVRALREFEDRKDYNRMCIIGFTYIRCKKNYKYNDHHMSMVKYNKQVIY